MISRKTTAEIDKLKEGGKRNAGILKELSDLVAPGLLTVRLEERARELIAKLGDRPAFLGYTPDGARRKFPAALCVSVNDEIVHGIPNEGEKILREGDIVTLDLGLLHDGLITDCAVTVPVGKISKEDEKLIEATRAALYAGIKATRAGAHIGDIGFAVSASAKKGKFNLAEDLAGHGVGYKVHEEPYVPNVGEKGKGEKLPAGAVLAIEPMLVAGSGEIVLDKDGYTFRTRDGSRAAHFEHTVALTEKGAIVLTEL